MSLIDGEPDRRSYAGIRRVAGVEGVAITTRECTTKSETRQKVDIKSTRISTGVIATKDHVREVTAKIDSVQNVIAMEDPMESDISEVLEILRRPLPSDSVLEFMISEDGYKKIIDEREKSNRKYRVWYDGQSHKVTINCCPSYLHERTSQIVIDSMVDEAIRVMRNAGVSDYVIARIKNAGNLTTSTPSQIKSYKEPDGLIIFDNAGWRGAYRIAFELGFSQSYSSLRQATMWWIEQKMATVAVLCCLTEVDKSSGAPHRVFQNIEQYGMEVDRYGVEFDRQRRDENCPLGPLEYNHYKWFGTLRDAFFEIYRDTDAGIAKSERVYLVKDGVDMTHAIPRDLTLKVGDFVPRDWLSDDVVGRLAVNFLRPQTFMEGLSDAILRTALHRVADTFDVEEY
ncbi:hypothetical protein V1525DRAFT_347129 [Lipomyces kononenkoae]|uniref:Uncharacterized protein n=1 Tax=Lipomyces kononenkoae TaxID=34357 RepID=A0ACC3SXV0_LIPKO